MKSNLETAISEDVLKREISGTETNHMNSLYDKFNAYTDKRRMAVLERDLNMSHVDVDDGKVSDRLNLLEHYWATNYNRDDFM